MLSCARVANPRCLRRLAIGAQVSNPKLTHYQHNHESNKDWTGAHMD
jgi:hypothetical protein